MDLLQQKLVLLGTFSIVHHLYHYEIIIKVNAQEVSSKTFAF